MAKTQASLHCINFDNVFIRPEATLFLKDIPPKYLENNIIINGALKGFSTNNPNYDETKIELVMSKIFSNEKYIAINLEQWKEFLETLSLSGNKIAIISFGSPHEIIVKTLELIGLGTEFIEKIAIITGVPKDFSIPKTHIENELAIKQNPNYFFENVLGYHIKAAMKHFGIASLEHVKLYDSCQHLIDEAATFGIPSTNAFCVDPNSKDFKHLHINAVEEIKDHMAQHGATIRDSGTIMIDLTKSFTSESNCDSSIGSITSSTQSLGNSDLKIEEFNFDESSD